MFDRLVKSSPYFGVSLRSVFLLLLLIYTPLLFASQARVLIDENSLAKEFVGPWTLTCLKPLISKDCSKMSKKFPHSKWRVERYYNELKIKDLVSKKTFQFKGQAFRLYGSFKLNNRTIQDLSLYFVDRKTQWVLQLPLDEYLNGVMASEVPVSWPIETLKAQAIASRTYFLHKKVQRTEENFDVRADTLDQVYSLDPIKHESIVLAIQQTKGQVLVTKDEKQIFPAFFHSDCGGHTSSEKNVWRKIASHNEEVKDPYCQTASKNNWSFTIARKQLLTLLQNALYLPKDVELKKILPRVSEENRAHVIDFLFSGNLLKRVSANDLRKVIGFEKLKSTQFQVSHYWDTIEFKGRGFGHGVGLCQWGAQRWARKGKNYEFILNHYYPNAKVKTLDEAHIKIYQAQLEAQ